MYAVSERDTSEKIFDLLQQAFGERRSDVQIKRELYDRYQGKKETLRSYSRALTELVNHLSSVSEVEKNKMLVEVLYLRNELRKKCRETPEVGFTQLRDFAIEVMPDECQEVGERASVRVNSVDAGVNSPVCTIEANSVESRLKALEERQLIIMDLIQKLPVNAGVSYTAESHDVGKLSSNVRCYSCHQFGHIARERNLLEVVKWGLGVRRISLLSLLLQQVESPKPPIREKSRPHCFESVSGGCSQYGLNYT